MKAVRDGVPGRPGVRQIYRGSTTFRTGYIYAALRVWTDHVAATTIAATTVRMP